MNDLRSSRKIAEVPEKQNQPTITKTPPRSRPAKGELDEDTKELRRRAARKKKRKAAVDQRENEAAEHRVARRDGLQSGAAKSDSFSTDAVAEVDLVEDSSSVAEAPVSRPTRRRDEADEDSKFPWHHQFEKDDEPQELRATSPLLSRAFRATTG